MTMLKKTVPFALSLALLAALAAAASAQTTATTTVTTEVTLGANPNVQTTGLSQKAYHNARDGSDYNVSDDLGGTLVFTDGSSTNPSGDGVTTFVASSTVSSRLDSPDYAAVPAPGPGYDFHFQGYLYFLTLTNPTAVDQTVSFHIKLSQASKASAASPYGLGLYDANGNPTRAGAYAESDYFGGVFDLDTELGLPDYPNIRTGFVATTIFATNVASPTYDASGVVDEYDADYILGASQTDTFELYASGYAGTQFNPVPEPALLAPLAVGALALLRRRRR